MAKISANIQAARAELLSGNLIGFPTETVYGLAGNALSEEVILKIFKTKNRPAFDPLIVHTYSIEEIRKYVRQIPEELEKLLTFTPGALTVLLPKNELIPDLVTSGLDQVAFRIPNHPLALALLQSLPFPLAAPSANPFGYVSPTTPQHVENQLGDKLNFILDGGHCSIGLESTIIGSEGEDLVVYRLGGITIEQLQQVTTKTIRVNQHSSSNPKAPGMLSSHYAPAKKLYHESNLLKEKAAFDKIGFIGFNTYHSEIPIANQLVLSAAGNIHEAAKNLFSTLRNIEKLSPEVFYVAEVPNIGIGRAINDRLSRAISRD